MPYAAPLSDIDFFRLFYYDIACKHDISRRYAIELRSFCKIFAIHFIIRKG